MNTAAGDYSEMARDYDEIMVLGAYYDYVGIAAELAADAGARRLLELGPGTGLILEPLLKLRSDYDLVTGVDVTPSMLDIARERLECYPQVDLHVQDVVTLTLPERYDLAFSYGGPWYFVPDGEGYAMISHIRHDHDNASGLERVAAHLAPGGRLLLGIQGQHVDYSRALGDGTTYTQHLFPLEGGFQKEYLRTRDSDGEQMMRQVLDYRVYSWAEATRLLAAAGLRPVTRPRRREPKFLGFAPA